MLLADAGFLCNRCTIGDESCDFDWPTTEIRTRLAAKNFAMNRKPRACVVILNENRDLLLIKRHQDNRKYWVLPGGSVESGETTETAAVREALEELSLVVTLKNRLFTQMNDGRFETYFLVDTYSGSVKLGNGPERDRQNINNTYEPVWLPRSDFANINLLPVSAKIKLENVVYL